MNKHVNTTAAASSATPIVSLAIRAEQSIAMFYKAEVVGRVSQGTKEAVSLKALTRAAAQHLNDEDSILRAMISLHKAQSLDDAAVQLAHACIYLDMLWDQFPNESRDHRVREDYRALLRLLHSVRDFVDGAVAHQRTAPFTAIHTNPWSHIETVKNYEVKA